LVNGDRIRGKLNVGHLQFIEEALLVSWKSAEDQSRLIENNKKPLREFGILLEVSPHHLLVAPPSHSTPQKVKGFVAG